MPEYHARPATSVPRKRRDAAPRSGYWMRARPQNAALAARLSLRAARISPQWPDMLKIRNAPLSLILTCAVLLGVAAPGAPALAQSLPADEPLRHTFLSAPAVAKVLGDAERISRST